MRRALQFKLPSYEIIIICVNVHLNIESLFPCKGVKCGYSWVSCPGLRTEASHVLMEKKEKMSICIIYFNRWKKCKDCAFAALSQRNSGVYAARDYVRTKAEASCGYVYMLIIIHVMPFYYWQNKTVIVYFCLDIISSDFMIQVLLWPERILQFNLFCIWESSGNIFFSSPTNFQQFRFLF